MLLTPPASPKPLGLCSSEDRLGHVLADRYELNGVLGMGAYGTVYRARDITTNAQYAVKALNKVGLDRRQRDFQDKEIQLHYRASEHHNVLSMVKILDFPDCTYVVLEYCPEGDLFAKITEERHYVGDEHKVKCVFLQLLDAVRHCHGQGVYHRDLKPENILVKDNGWTIKLADFGLATPDRVTSDFGCGSTFYMSPECQETNPKPFACYASAPNDIWSLGVILVNLTCGRNPWKRASMDDSTFRAFAKDRNFLQSILSVSDELHYILQRIFEVDPQRRISLSQLRELIIACPTFDRSPTPVVRLPPTPSYSPVAFAAQIHGATGPLILDVPPMDPLPAQLYPSIAGHDFYSPPLRRPTSPPTPPGSNHCSPRLAPTTVTTKPVAPASGSYTGPSMYMPQFPVWPACGQFISNFNVPRGACFWNNVPAL